jgi:ribonucleoside-diphosphate reductase alpha chain
MSAIERPEILNGATYKLRAPHIEHAIFVTVNDAVLPDGRRRMREVFVNSKSVEEIGWMVQALRELSQNLARIESDDEMREKIEDWKASFDPKNGGYVMPGAKKQCLGIQSHIGHVLDAHHSRTKKEDDLRWTDEPVKE